MRSCCLFQLTISDQPIEKMSNTIEPQAVDKIKQGQPEEIRIEVIKHEDTEEILIMLKEFFYKVRQFLLEEY